MDVTFGEVKHSCPSISFIAFGGINAWLTKTDGSGNIQWSKAFGIGKSYYVQQTSDGGYIAAGWTESGGNKDVLLRKVSGESTKTVKTPTASSIKTPIVESTRTSTVSPTGTQTEIPIDSPTEKTSGFEIVLSITTLSILYVLWRKRG